MDIKNYYKNVASGGVVGNEPRIDMVKKLIPKDSIVLDVGCYDGVVASNYLSNCSSIIGIDIHAKPVEIAKTKINNAFVVDIDSEKWPFESNSFDVITISAVLEHIFDYNFVFSEMNRVLRPNGILIHATPNAASLRSRVELLSADVPNWFKNFEHIRMWTPKYLSKILLSYNFIRNSLHGSPVSSTLNKKIFSYLFPSLAPIFVESYILRKDE